MTSWAAPRGGNNNAYCLDSDVSWIDWERVDASILEHCTRAIEVRRAHRALRDAATHAEWRQADGQAIAPDGDDATPCVASLRLTSDDDVVVVLFNAGGSDASLRLPGPREDEYAEVLSSAAPLAAVRALRGGDEVAVAAGSITVLAVTSAPRGASAGQPR